MTAIEDDGIEYPLDQGTTERVQVAFCEAKPAFAKTMGNTNTNTITMKDKILAQLVGK